MAFNFNDLNNLDVENIGEWPLLLRLFVVGLVCVVVIFVGYNLHIENKLSQLANISSQESSLKQQVRGTAIRLAKERATHADLKQMKAIFGQVLNTLPKQFQIPFLLEAISKVGHDNNLKFRLLKPRKEEPHLFYSVIPIRIVADGDYHQIAKFVSDLANLNQPIRFTNLIIHPVKKHAAEQSHANMHVFDSGTLILELTAEVYRNNSEVLG